MAEEIGLRVKVSTVGDKGAMDRLKGNISKSVSDGAAKANIKLPGFLGGLQSGIERTTGMLGRSRSMASSVPGGAGRAGGMGIGSLAGLTIIGAGILKGVQAMVDRLAKASPMLRSIMRQMDVGVNMVLRPLGDSLARLLRPISRWLMEYGMRNAELADMQEMALRDMGLEGTVLDVVMFITNLANVLGIIPQSIIQWNVWWMSELYNVAAGAVGSLGNWLGGVATWFRDAINGAGAAIDEALGGIPSWLWGEITRAFDGAWDTLSGFGSWLWSGLKGTITFQALSGLGSWVKEQFKNAFSTINSALGGIPYEAYKVFHNAIAAIPNGIRNIELPLVGKPFTFIPEVAYLAAGGITNGPTIAMIGEGRGGTQREVVSPLNELPRLLGLDQRRGFDVPKIEVHIQGNVYGVRDLEAAIEEGVNKYIHRVRPY